MKIKTHHTALKSLFRGTDMSFRPLKWILLGPILALMLHAHSFGGEPTAPPPDQPAQIRSQVTYGPKLCDRFFESKKRTYSKNTATGTNALDGKHPIWLRKAKLSDGNTIELSFYSDYLGVREDLMIVVQNGVFWSEYSFDHIHRPLGVDPRSIWTTKRQKLVLHKRLYRKGEVIKGRFYVEGVSEYTHPKMVAKYGKNPITVRLKGSFEMKLE